jgi:hypothetical protein
VAPPVWLTGDLSGGMAGFLAMGITAAGFLAWGWRWCAPYLLVASVVALTLLLAPDSYAAFGLIFLALVVAAAVVGRGYIASWVRLHSRRHFGARFAST